MLVFRSVVAGTLAAALAGCGGGGGGGAIQPDDYPYPTLASAVPADTGNGLHANYTLDDTTKQFIAAPAATVSAAVNSPAAEQIKLTVANFAGDSFNVTLPIATLGSTPLAGSPLPGCPSCLRAPTVAPIASDGKAVSFVYLDPAAAGLQYSTLGLWSKERSSDDPATDVFVGGAFSLGVLTRGVDLPTVGTASYAGPFVGRYADGTNTYLVGAAASASANFGTRSVSFATTSTQIARELGGGTLALPAAEARLNLSGTLNYAPGANQLAGTVFTSSVAAGGFGMTGTIQGAFYGPPARTATPPAPAELGGTLTATNAAIGGTRQLNGAFALKRQ